MLSVLNIKTSKRNEMIDITGMLLKTISESGVRDGICTIFNPHTTAAVTINENADPSVQRDILSELAKVFPEDHGYTHAEGNSDAHIKASLTGSDRNIIINNGTLILGTWQGVYFCEFDGPRSRKIYVKIIAD